MVGHIQNYFNFNLLSKTSDNKEVKLTQLAKQCLKDPSAKQHYESLRADIIVEAFDMKKNDSNYKMSALVQKVYDTALKITDPKGKEQILDHGREYAFLTSERHYLHKHIETLEKWNPGTAKVQVKDDKLVLRTYQDRRLDHKVTGLMRYAEDNPSAVLDYNYYSIDERVDHPKELKPAFKTKGDGQFHVSIVADCPEKKMQMQGQHAWLRLIDAEGKVYSVGKFPKDLHLPYVYAKEEVMYSSSDSHEWLCRKDSIHENRFTIKEEDFEKIKKSITHDLNEKRTKQDFNTFHENCSDWAISKLNLVGLHIDKEAFQVDQFAVLFPTLSEIYDDHMPKALKKVFDPVLNAISYVALQVVRVAMIVFLGGFRKNSENKKSECFLQSPKKIFDYELTTLTHPWRMTKFLEKNRDNIQAIYDKNLAA